jgi:hypothetical protein
MAKSNNNLTGWVGWIAFASAMLFVGGIFNIFAGFVALIKNDVFINAGNSVYMLSYNQWGWTHIIIGILALIAAGSLASGNMFGRVAAVLIAVISAVANMAFVPVYPFWSLMVIVIDVLVIYAVTVHGKEVKNLS